MAKALKELIAHALVDRRHLSEGVFILRTRHGFQ
jgi:hypothetical protein